MNVGLFLLISVDEPDEPSTLQKPKCDRQLLSMARRPRNRHSCGSSPPPKGKLESNRMIRVYTVSGQNEQESQLVLRYLGGCVWGDVENIWWYVWRFWEGIWMCVYVDAFIQRYFTKRGGY